MLLELSPPLFCPFCCPTAVRARFVCSYRVDTVPKTADLLEFLPFGNLMGSFVTVPHCFWTQLFWSWCNDLELPKTSDYLSSVVCVTIVPFTLLLESCSFLGYGEHVSVCTLFVCGERLCMLHIFSKPKKTYLIYKKYLRFHVDVKARVERACSSSMSAWATLCRHSCRV